MARQAASTMAQRNSRRPFFVTPALACWCKCLFFLVGLAAVVNPGSQPRISYQQLRIFKTRNVSNGCQHGHRHNEPHARQLHELQGRFAPGRARALALEFFIHRSFQLFDFLQQCQFLTDLHLLQKADVFLCFPPGLIQQPVLGQFQVVLV